MELVQLFSHIDHTLLKACATWPEVEVICRESVEFNMASACIPPSFVRRAREAFGKQLVLCTVVGFPLGYVPTEAKLFEAQQALENGADELDMVVNLGDARSARFNEVTKEISLLKQLAGHNVLKVIVEACYLDEAEKIALCQCVTQAGADYIKTSTGFAPGGATLADVLLFQEHIGPRVKIKAAGGIRTKLQMEAFIEAGCSRIGSSGAITLLQEKIEEK